MPATGEGGGANRASARAAVMGDSQGASRLKNLRERSERNRSARGERGKPDRREGETRAPRARNARVAGSRPNAGEAKRSRVRAAEWSRATARATTPGGGIRPAKRAKSPEQQTAPTHTNPEQGRGASHEKATLGAKM